MDLFFGRPNRERRIEIRENEGIIKQKNARQPDRKTETEMSNMKEYQFPAVDLLLDSPDTSKFQSQDYVLKKR